MDDELTTAQWDTADAIARTLVREGVKVNELQKAIAYLRTYSASEGAKFFTYLQVLAKEGQRVGHSKKTQEYYETLNRTCRQYLQGMSEDVPTMLRLLGWSARLLRYYSEGVPTGAIPEPMVRSAREAEIQAITAESEFAVGQVWDAISLTIKGNKVTYQIQEVIKLTQKEPKLVGHLSEGQSLRVEIMEMHEDGRIKKVRKIE